MTPHYEDDAVTLYHGDCLDVLRELDDNSVDAVVTDPPYNLSFMGKAWDDHTTAVAFQQWCEAWATECLRVLKPGGHMLAFGGSRTWHRLASAIEDAGFEIRDSIAWLYGSGFPKSLDVSKAIDKAAGAERTKTRKPGAASAYSANAGNDRPWMQLAKTQGFIEVDGDTPTTPDAEQWQGWGTALKPAHEPVVCARKPYSDKAILARIGSQLSALEDLCRRRANDAGPSSVPTPPGSPEVRIGSALASAATLPAAAPEKPTATGVEAASFGATATSVSEWMDETFSSTATSWQECWAELWQATNTSTTSTATSRTTDLETLSSCLSSIMRSVTAPSTPDLDSLRSLVEAVDNLFAAGVLSSRSTLALSAIENATNETPPTSPAADGSSAAHEPIVVARKPLAAGTVAANVLAHGTGALNIDATRIEGDVPATTRGSNQFGVINDDGWKPSQTGARIEPHGAGRWPANVILDQSQADQLDKQSGTLTSGVMRAGTKPKGERETYGKDVAGGYETKRDTPGDTGGASRFFYIAKANSSERPSYVKADADDAMFAGSVRKRCTICGKQEVNMPGSMCVCPEPDFQPDPSMQGKVAHPTVKPLDLMRWLVRLVTPPGGTVLDPFAGSGTTAEACIIEHFRCITIERDDTYLPLIVARLTKPIQVGLDFGGDVA